MALLEERISEFGKTILAQASTGKVVSLDSISKKMMDMMMRSESFRIASLRFTDVAPALRTDEEFIDHMQAYFSELPGALGFLGKNIPSSKLTSGLISSTARKSIQTLATSFIAAENIDDGLSSLENLHNNGIASSVDILGEAVLCTSESRMFIKAYEEAIDKISEASSTWAYGQFPESDDIGPIARANVSIKLSALYPHIKPIAHEASVKALVSVFSKLLDHAMKKNVFINVDMEQYSLLPLTLDVFEQTLSIEKYKSYPHVGIVCQGYLKESENILNRLIAFAKKRGTPFSIRLVKGAYWDFESAYAEQMHWSAPVFSEKESTDANYEKLTKQLIYAFPHVRPCIASHNVRSLANAIALTEKRGLDKANVEFQMLYGMAEPFRNALRDMGFRVRQYCPIGEFIPGMSYLVRRLLENTANQSFLRMQSFDKKDMDELLRKPEFIDKEPMQTAGFKNHPELDFSKQENRQKALDALEKFKPSFPHKVGRSLKRVNIKHTCPWDTDLETTHITSHTKKDAENALSAAEKAFPSWRDMGASERANILNKAADLMTENWDKLFALQVFEAGKDWAHADADICEAIDFMRFYAEKCQQLEQDMQPTSVWGESNEVIYEPKGVCAVIAPWNFPLAISVGMTSAALATGNTVVYKPAEQTSAMGAKMFNIFMEAGLPKGVLSIIFGEGETVGETLVTSPKTNLIAFTGSREVGLKILEKSASVQKGQQHTKQCIIEMGGKNAMIVDSGADLDEAVPAIASSAFGFQGQKCSACSRVIVVGSAYKPLLKRLKEVVSELKVGTANDPYFDTNAVIDTEAFNKISKYIKRGEKDGKVLAKGENHSENGNFITPTVFIDIPLDSPLTTEEIFGPVLCVYHAETLDDALAMATNSEFALTGGLFTRNPRSIEKIKNEYRVGNLYINRNITGALVGRQPFGGGKMSGTGTKAGGADYLYNFVEPRTITENTMRRGYAPK